VTDSLSPVERSLRMGMVKAKDTKPELLVRSLVHRLGYRYRLHAKYLPGNPDLVFSSRKKVIFVHGCFWHRHDAPTCKLARLPKSKLDFWLPKLEANMRRDVRTLKSLQSLGWESLILWECQLINTQTVREAVMLFLGDPRR
jgi:DNA mismatch endonuclease (patch repair protein)